VPGQVHLPVKLSSALARLAQEAKVASSKIHLAMFTWTEGLMVLRQSTQCN